MKYIILFLLMMTSSLFAGLLDTDKYWAYTYYERNGDHSYTEELVLRTYKNGTYKIYTEEEILSEGKLIIHKKNDEYILVDSLGEMIGRLKTNGKFSVIITTSKVLNFIEINPPESYK